ncbi:MAG: short-chain dehydrogenase [Gammaproteobacteria bacterium]|jgi:NAD(P)-dependent dehydrogenase (short-subunit alcohol dehydrogenase family)|nr:short-chain dehydrogenase [Gammaproteobacteria bacterium]
MARQQSAVVVGGSTGIGLAVSKALAARGETVYVTSRDKARADEAARQIGACAKGLAVDLSDPAEIGAQLSEVGPVDHLVIAAIERDENAVKSYDVTRAIRIVTLKLVGYTEVIHALVSRFTPNASIVLFGGQARARPYPGSTCVTTINGGVSAMIGTLATELAPIRVNAIHPGIVGDSAAWSGKTEVTERTAARTPTGRLVTLEDCAGAVVFLLDNRGVNGVNLAVDGGWTLL